MFAKRKSIMPISSSFPLGLLKLKGQCGRSNAGSGFRWLCLGGRHVRRGGAGKGIAGSQGSRGAWLPAWLFQRRSAGAAGSAPCPGLQSRGWVPAAPPGAAGAPPPSSA